MKNKKVINETNRNIPVLILKGGDFADRTSARPCVISRCELRLKSEEMITECEKSFIQFEEILRRRLDSEIKYEWANVYRAGLVVTFDVNWYDRRFFEERKDAYKVGPHPFAFQRFGAVAEDFEIHHESVDDG